MGQYCRRIWVQNSADKNVLIISLKFATSLGLYIGDFTFCSRQLTPGLLADWYFAIPRKKCHTTWRTSVGWKTVKYLMKKPVTANSSQ